jgi:hypothetical protein
LPAAACASKSARRAATAAASSSVKVACCPTTGNMLVSNARTYDVSARRSWRPSVEMPLAGLSGSAGLAKSGMPKGFGGMLLVPLKSTGTVVWMKTNAVKKCSTVAVAPSCW